MGSTPTGVTIKCAKRLRLSHELRPEKVLQSAGVLPRGPPVRPHTAHGSVTQMAECLLETEKVGVSESPRPTSRRIGFESRRGLGRGLVV